MSLLRQVCHSLAEAHSRDLVHRDIKPANIDVCRMGLDYDFRQGAHYSIQNTTRPALFLPTSREAKYKAKQAIDSFFWRAGDLLQAGIVFLGTRLVPGLRGSALLNLAFVAVWLVIVAGIARSIATGFRPVRQGCQPESQPMKLPILPLLLTLALSASSAQAQISDVRPQDPGGSGRSRGCRRRRRVPNARRTSPPGWPAP